jgi:galactose mutarotase-like enzyme
MLHQSEHSICLVLQQNEETLKSYPFHFTLLITYTLNDNSLTQRFRVINTDTKEVLTSFGGHPAFNANPVEDFEIIFDKPESVPSNKLAGPYINEETYSIIDHTKISLTQHTFDDDALIFQNLKSDWIRLRHTKSNYQVAMRINEFPYLGIWAKPGAPYVCLEPWQGLADFTTHDKQLKNKLGIITIPVGGEVQKEFEMVFMPA